MADTSTTGMAPADRHLVGPPEKQRPRANGASAETPKQDVIVNEPTPERKAFTNLRARLALAGYALHCTAPDDGPTFYTVGRWASSRTLASLDEVADFATRVGVKP